MYHARATFNAFLRSLCDEGIPLHTETDDPTKWPSYRITWISILPTSRAGQMAAIIQLDVSVPNSDTATAWQRAARLQWALGLTNYTERPRIQKRDWTDPDNPIDLPMWMEYGVRWGQGWRASTIDDPQKRILSLTLEVIFDAQ